jgi:hypothetical protein
MVQIVAVASSVLSLNPPQWSRKRNHPKIVSVVVDTYFWEIAGLERGPLSLVSTIEELLERKSSGSGIENREYGRRDSSRWPRGTLDPRKLALISLSSGSRSVGIVSSRTRATEFNFLVDSYILLNFPILCEVKEIVNVGIVLLCRIFISASRCINVSSKHVWLSPSFYSTQNQPPKRL